MVPAALPMQHVHWSSHLCFICYYFLFLQGIFLRIFKPTELLPLHVILWHCRKRAKSRAGIVRTVTTQCKSHFLLLTVMLQVQEQKQPCGKILHRFLLSLCKSRTPSWAPSPRELGMLENKYIPFRKQDKERFDNIDLVHKRCSSAWKGQCVTMQFQYRGCFDCLFFLLFFPLAVKLRSFAKESLILELLLRGNYMLPASVKDAGNLCATLELNLALSGSWYLAPTSICPWVQCFILFSRYPYLNSAIESSYPQANQMFFAGGRY